MSNEYQESYHFIVSHPEAVAREMTRYCATITRLTAENEKLLAALMKAREQMQWLAENERECLGVVAMDDGSEVPAIWIAVANIDAALDNNQ